MFYFQVFEYLNHDLKKWMNNYYGKGPVPPIDPYVIKVIEADYTYTTKVSTTLINKKIYLQYSINISIPYAFKIKGYGILKKICLLGNRINNVFRPVL